MLLSQKYNLCESSRYPGDPGTKHAYTGFNLVFHFLNVSLHNNVYISSMNNTVCFKSGHAPDHSFYIL